MTQIKEAKQRLSDKNFINTFMLKEHDDQKKRVFTRIIPMISIIIIAICALFWWFGNMIAWWLPYLGYIIAIGIAFAAISKMILPHLKGPLSIYYGKDPVYKQKLGVVIPLRKDTIKKISKKWGWTSYEYENVQNNTFHFCFLIAYTNKVDSEVVKKEIEIVKKLLEEQPKVNYSEFRKMLTKHNFKGKIKYVLSENTFFEPEKYNYCRSYGIPKQDNISIYHTEELTSYKMVLGYSKNDETQFIPFYKQMWNDFSSL